MPGLNLNGGLLYAGVNGLPRGIYNPDRNNFAPRIGVAYSLNNKTIVAGYALTYIALVGVVYELPTATRRRWCLRKTASRERPAAQPVSEWSTASHGR